jgi:uncharacterized protein (DUF885 family)
MVVWLTGLMWGAGMAVHPEDTGLQDRFRQYLDARFQLRPLEATELGDHRHDARLDDLSAEALGRWSTFLKQTRDALIRDVDPDQLSSDGRLDFEIWVQDLDRQLWLEANTNPWSDDPRVYNRFITESVYMLLTQSTAPLETNVTHALSRIAEVPRVLAAARANLGRPPGTHTETAIRQNRGAIAFYESQLAGLVGKSRRRADLIAAGRELAGALKEYQRFLEEELLPRADGDWRLGRERFAQKLEFELNAGVPAATVLEQAGREFTRVRSEMYVLARQLWHQTAPGRALPADDAGGRQETTGEVLRAIGRDHGETRHLTRDAGRMVKGLRAFIRDRDFLRLPEPDQCRVIEMPEFQRGNWTAYLNPAPPLDPRAGSFYAVSPPPADWSAEQVTSYLEEYKRRMLQILSIHEAYPGHYVQLEYGNRHPSLIRRVLQSGTFVEGWAVYTEQAMLDEGYGGGDLGLRLMQLKFYLRAVVNALLDHRMHCTAMTEEEAMRLLTRDAFQSEGEARLKVIRARQSSCQLSTYFVGRMALYGLRQEIQREWGDRFELGRYHEAVLAHGAVPTRYLPALVRRRLAEPR